MASGFFSSSSSSLDDDDSLLCDADDNRPAAGDIEWFRAFDTTLLAAPMERSAGDRRAGDRFVGDDR